jgi:hypothetical protein
LNLLVHQKCPISHDSILPTAIKRCSKGLFRSFFGNQLILVHQLQCVAADLQVYPAGPRGYNNKLPSNENRYFICFHFVYKICLLL